MSAGTTGACLIPGLATACRRASGTVPPEFRRPSTRICLAAGFSVGGCPRFCTKGAAARGPDSAMVSCSHPACAGVAEPRAQEVRCQRNASLPGTPRCRGCGPGASVGDQSRQATVPRLPTVRVNKRPRVDFSARGFIATEGNRSNVHMGRRWCGMAGDPAWIVPGTAWAGPARGARVHLGIDSRPPADRCQRPPNPVMVMPWTKKRWAKMKSTRMGASMIVLTANTISQCCTSKSLNILTPTARGNLSMVLR